MEHIGARIRQARLGHQPPLRLADLAGDDLSIAMVSRIERGLANPSFSTLEYLAHRLGLSVGELFGPPASGDSPARGEDDADAGAAAVDAARALLLLGDPAAAAERALAGAGVAAGAWRARALGMAAEALLAAGNAPAAAQRLKEASDALAAGQPKGPPVEAAGRVTAVARAELAWVLGLLERRRGDWTSAERSWGCCLDLLDGGALQPLVDQAPGLRTLRCRVLAELGGLSDALGALETARHFFTRAAALLERAAQPALAARDYLAAAGPLATAQPATGHLATTDPALAAALALAEQVASAALRERVAHDLARLERARAPWPARQAILDVPHSRHLG